MYYNAFSPLMSIKIFSATQKIYRKTGRRERLSFQPVVENKVHNHKISSLHCLFIQKNMVIFRIILNISLIPHCEFILVLHKTLKYISKNSYVKFY